MSRQRRVITEAEREKQAPVFRQILDRYIAGWSWASIAAQLTSQGFATYTGARWTDLAVAKTTRQLLGPETLSPAQRRRRRQAERATRTRRQSPAETADTDVAAVPALLPPIEGALPDEIVEYLAWRATSRGEATVRRDERVIRRLVAQIGLEDFWLRFDVAALRSFQRALPAAQPHASTRHGELSALRVFLRHAYDEGWMARDLSGRVALPGLPRREPRPIPAELVPGMLAALPRDTRKDLQVRALEYFLISTGCRISEALSVDRVDVQWRDRVRIRDTVRVRGLKYSGIRTVLLLPAASAALHEYLDRRGDDPCPALFVSHVDTPGSRRRMTRSTAGRLHRQLRRRMMPNPGMTAFTSPHVARHTAATMLMEVTQDPRLVQEVLGHSSLRNLGVYTEVTDRRKRAIFAPGSRFSELLRDTGSPV